VCIDLNNFTVNAAYLFECFALHVSTTKGNLQVIQTMYTVIILFAYMSLNSFVFGFLIKQITTYIS
jgi:hypothetical protein